MHHTSMSKLPAIIMVMQNLNPIMHAPSIEPIHTNTRRLEETVQTQRLSLFLNKINHYCGFLQVSIPLEKKSTMIFDALPQRVSKKIQAFAKDAHMHSKLLKDGRLEIKY